MKSNLMCDQEVLSCACPTCLLARLVDCMREESGKRISLLEKQVDALRKEIQILKGEVDLDSHSGY